MSNEIKISPLLSLGSKEVYIKHKNIQCKLWRYKKVKAMRKWKLYKQDIDAALYVAILAQRLGKEHCNMILFFKPTYQAITLKQTMNLRYTIWF